MRLRFGDCTYDPDARELRRAGEAVVLSPRAFQLLGLLLEQRPRALSHERLRDALWPDTLVGYTSLAQLVTEVRKAIGDSSRNPGLVRTIPRFGYSFSGEVAQDPESAPPVYVAAFVSAEREFLIASGETLVGRGEGCGIRLPSSGVSRVHARVRADGREVAVEDTGSKNGTWINGTRREGPTPLAEGDEVTFGTFRVVFHAAASAGSTRTGPPR